MVINTGPTPDTAKRTNIGTKGEITSIIFNPSQSAMDLSQPVAPINKNGPRRARFPHHI